MSLFNLESDTRVPAVNSGAEFSECRTYRYALWRHWDWEGYASCCMFIGLNPSTADETVNDPTIRRCINFAKSWGYGGIYMMNLYAFRATLPTDMVKAVDPVGPGNDQAFGYYRSKVGKVVAAWGSIETRYRPRLSWSSRIKAVLSQVNQPVWCLGKTQDGSPRHPLYVKGDTELIPFCV